MEKARDPGRCQVRSGTDHPCEGMAVTEIWGVLFCESCAREQAAYTAIGEIFWEPALERAPRTPDVELLVDFAGDFPGRLAESSRLLRAAKQEILSGRAPSEESR